MTIAIEDNTSYTHSLLVHTLATRAHTIHTLVTRTHPIRTLTTRTHPIHTHYTDTHQLYSPTADNILAIKISITPAANIQQYKRAEQPALAKMYVLNHNELRYHAILLFNAL